MPDRASLQALKHLIEETDLLISTTEPLPENRTAVCRENLRAALALTDDLMKSSKTSKASPAAVLGSKGGLSTARKLGADHFRQMAASRKTRGGGRPRKTDQ
jgi:hypothetical protein